MPGSWKYHKYISFLDFPDRYGKVKGIEDFCLKAQLVSYDQYRSLQEAFNYKMWDWYSGMLVWKNQNPWTGLRGSFYDYYLDCQGGYYGYRHGAAPLHIQFNLNDSSVCIVNQTALKADNITASIRLFDLHGKLISEQNKLISQEAHSVNLLPKITLPVSGSSICFLRLELKDPLGKVLDENFYWLTAKSRSYADLNQLEKVKLQMTPENNSNTGHSIVVKNPGNETAFFIRIKVVDEKGSLVLPLYLDDNFFTLLPGESRKVRLDCMDSGQSVSGARKASVEGWNIEPAEIGIQ